MRFPAGRPHSAEPAARLGLEASGRHTGGALELVVRAHRLAYGVRVHVEGFTPSDDAFFVEPGRERVVLLRADEPGAEVVGGFLTALNLQGRVKLQFGDE